MTPLLGRIAPVRAARWDFVRDLCVVILALFAANHATGGTWDSAYLHARLVVVVSVWIVAAAALHHYDPWANERSAMDDVMMVTFLCASVALCVFGLNKFAPADVPVPRSISFFTHLWPIAVTTRLMIFRRLARREGPLDEVIVVGTGAMGRVTGEDLEKSNRRRVLGYLSFSHESKPTHLGYKYLGSADALESILKGMAVTEVYIAGNVLKTGAEMQAAISTCERQGVPFALPATTFRFERAQVVSLQSVLDGYMHYVPFGPKPHQMALKRLFDVAASALALWVLAPVLLLIAVAIKLTSRGPVLFRQQRVGLNGQTFNMLKFRSMVIDAEKRQAALLAVNEQKGPVFKIKNDPRITRVGRFIRKYSLDELPQLLNVLRGDMSVVGPRPPIPSEVAKYETWQRRRLSMRPGLTCIWQVSGRNQISFEDWMYLDMNYIDHWSFALDMNLIFKTVPVVLTGRGAS
jgi:exopolysaccharide biosynthesis polyprenyl glycosylphosphotransferase